ncbi:MAG: hypothetical protein IT289_04845 [Oligoflexia bacterium]|nr:hypothetical protein [Oligoflexia bacterium]
MNSYFKYTICILISLIMTACGNPSVEYNPEGSTSSDIPETVLTLFSDAAGVTMTNAAAAGTELTGNISRAYIDLSSYTMIRGQFSSSLASATINCRIEYSTNNGGSWSTLVPNFAAAAVANAHNNSAWVEIPDAAKTGVLLRALTVGDGVLDPIIKYVRIGFY